MKSQNNPYELLYMYRLGDEKALNMLFKNYEALFVSIVDNAVSTRRELHIYREDLMQEARCAMLEAIESYREDRNASFSTFLAVVAKRRIWKVLRYYLNGTRVQFHECVYLEDETESGTKLYNLFSQPDRMAEPEFYTNYRVAEDALYDTVQDMTEMERKILHAWMSEESYEIASKHCGIGVRGYDGRLQRLKKKIKNSIKFNVHG